MRALDDPIAKHKNFSDQIRLELLTFNLSPTQKFGMNVFKIREVIQSPTLTKVPSAHPCICGLITIRGQTISVIDLAAAIGLEPLDSSTSWIIISEYNHSIQGFLVHSVDRIINTSWQEITPPPNGTQSINHLTAITQVDEVLVPIIDVEQVLADIIGIDLTISNDTTQHFKQTVQSHHHILLIDDSIVARKQVQGVIDKLGISCDIAKNGQEGLQILQRLLEEGLSVTQTYSMILCDIEMPLLDGYSFTKIIKEHAQLKDLFVCLHSSISGNFNDSIIKTVQADKFVSKMNPDALTKIFYERFQEVEAEREMESVQ